MNNQVSKDEIIEELEEELDFMGTKLTSAESHLDRYRQMLLVFCPNGLFSCDRCKELWSEKDFIDEDREFCSNCQSVICGICITELTEEGTDIWCPSGCGVPL